VFLITYGYSVAFFGLISGIIAIYSFLYMADYSSSNDNAERNVSRFNLGTGLVSVIFFVGSYIPASLAITHAERGKHSLSAREWENQTSEVLWVANGISLLASIVMIIFDSSVVSLNDTAPSSGSSLSFYGLLYAGVTVFLSSIIGLWVSCTKHRSVVRFYYALVVPFSIIVVFVIAVASMITIASSTVNNSVSSWNILCLLTSIYLIFLGTFQLVSFYNAKSRDFLMFAVRNKLDVIMKRSSTTQLTTEMLTLVSELSHFNPEDGEDLLAGSRVGFGKRDRLTRFRTKSDRLITFYGMIMGLFDIFYSLSYIVYARLHNNGDNNTNWFGTLFRVLGKGDRRYDYNNADDFFVTMTAIYAILVGPLLIFYAWSTFVGASWRHVVGCVVCTLLLFSQVLTYGIEISSGGENYNEGHEGLLTLILLPSIIVNILIPLAIIIREIQESTSKTRKSEHIERIIEAKKAIDTRGGFGWNDPDNEHKSTKVRRDVSRNGHNKVGNYDSGLMESPPTLQSIDEENVIERAATETGDSPSPPAVINTLNRSRFYSDEDATNLMQDVRTNMGSISQLTSKDEAVLFLTALAQMEADESIDHMTL
jgi:MFS family permease